MKDRTALIGSDDPPPDLAVLDRALTDLGILVGVASDPLPPFEDWLARRKYVFDGLPWVDVTFAREDVSEARELWAKLSHGPCPLHAAYYDDYCPWWPFGLEGRCRDMDGVRKRFEGGRFFPIVGSANSDLPWTYNCFIVAEVYRSIVGAGRVFICPSKERTDLVPRYRSVIPVLRMILPRSIGLDAERIRQAVIRVAGKTDDANRPFDSWNPQGRWSCRLYERGFGSEFALACWDPFTKAAAERDRRFLEPRFPLDRDWVADKVRSHLLGLGLEGWARRVESSLDREFSVCSIGMIGQDALTDGFDYDRRGPSIGEDLRPEYLARFARSILTTLAAEANAVYFPPSCRLLGLMGWTKTAEFLRTLDFTQPPG